ncbi:beta-lactamase family protein [Flagellimonas sp. HMM57]|uniref:serine hydrolase domain-containing protein n=1 Tax=unclassified Flagellimonas TaxID=2644544 RepID=UPI0013D1CF2E|nr:MULTISPECIES: serine hydrolase domain-containing protein [unclassified Flagellimonas]UII74514.1 beta-lactamase family protein [Flagellimonas sp. HMM57]
MKKNNPRKNQPSKSFPSVLSSTHIFLILLLVAATVPTALRAQQNSNTIKANQLLKQTIQKNNLPSLSIAVAKQGQLIYASAQGFADLELKVPATPESVYRIGSISKSISAVLTMVLLEKGKLKIDAPIQTYCRSFPDKGVSISLKQLLTHQGGIRHYKFDKIEEEYFSITRYSSSEEATSIFKNDTLIARSGTKHFYSTYGYTLIGCAIESLTNTSFEEALKKYIFDVAQMNNTELDYYDEIIPDRAKTYNVEKDGSFKNTRQVDLSNKFPGGGILSTPTDLVKFGNALLDHRLLNSSTREKMWKEQKTTNGESTNYALGWRVSNDEKQIFHGGSSAGGKSFLFIIPEEQLVVAFTTNSSSFSSSRLEFAQQIATLFLK